MIGYLEGTLLHKHPPRLVVVVHGIGYELEAPLGTFYDLPEPGAVVRLHTHLQVREDAHLLFGFSDIRQRDLFRMLLRVSGIGPRVALAVMSGMSADDLVDCVRNDDLARLVRVPGIGRKTAERLILDLRDRLAGPGPGGEPTLSGVTGRVPTAREDAVSALIALGYQAAEANQAVGRIDGDAGGSEELIRQALHLLSGRP